MKWQKQWFRRPGGLTGLIGSILLLAAFNAGAALFGTDPATRDAQIAAVKAERRDAIFKVQSIVNQPVTQLKRKPDMIVTMFSYWFHVGANEPDYNTVDIRTTRQLSYESYPYVASDLNPNVVFVGRELEFNSMTKFFFSNRSVPKKKLTEAEMLEINRLYRVIGHCNQQLADLQKPRTSFLGMDVTSIRDTMAGCLQSKMASSIVGSFSKYTCFLVAFALLLLIAFFWVRSRRSHAD